MLSQTALLFFQTKLIVAMVNGTTVSYSLLRQLANYRDNDQYFSNVIVVDMVMNRNAV